MTTWMIKFSWKISLMCCKQKKAKLLGNLATLTVLTPSFDGYDNDSTSDMFKLCHQMSKTISDLKLHSSNTPIGHLVGEVSNGINNKTDKS